jgi:hypothetical protein
MRKFTLLLALLGFVMGSVSQAQSTSGKLKGSGEVFFYETFDWGNPDVPHGWHNWQQPEGYYMEDPTDTGFNFHWWPNEPLKAMFVDEPAFQSTSKEDGHLCLFAGKYNDFMSVADGPPAIDNYIGFPTFDFSDKASVVLRYETNFMEYSPLADGMQVMVSNDAGVHWAMLDCDFGVQHKDRPNDVSPGEPAIFQANISDVAAGMPEVLIKFWWHGTPFYYWLIDDFQLAEAWDNDLQMQHFSIEWDDGDENTVSSFTGNWPLSQLMGSAINMQASVLNFGEFDQYDTHLEVDITRNSQSVWTGTSEMLDSWAGLIDTLKVEDSWTPPAEYGHYKFTYKFKQEQEEQTPEDTYKEFFMNVTDSIYSRSDDTSELNWSYSFERYADSTDDGMLLDHFVGVEFPIYADCEVNSVSVYITGGLADGLIEFAGSLWLVPPADMEEEPFEMLVGRDIFVLDSSMFGTWVTMPLEKDGESEFLLAGDVVRAGLMYWNYHTDMLTNRNKGLGMAADKTVPVNDRVSYAKSSDTWFGNRYITDRVLMVRLNLNDNGNIIDAVNLDANLSSLEQNYPNPFNDRTEINYTLANADDVSIEISDITGRVIKELNEGFRSTGKHTVTVNASDYESGIYFYTLKAGDFVQTKRMVIK